MTVTERDYVLEAHFVHAVIRSRPERAQLIAKRVRFRVASRDNSGGDDRNKWNLQRVLAPSLKTLMKKNSKNVKHHVRTIKIGPQNNYSNNALSDEKALIQIPSPTNAAPIEARPHSNEEQNFNVERISPNFNPQQTIQWLTQNRFERYLQTFVNFSGADMLRMTRDDLIQICGHADGIRLFNALHTKSIAPKFTIYVCRDNSSVFRAIPLFNFNTSELIQKLCIIACVAQDQIRDIYLLGPQGIHIQINNELLMQFKDESTYHLEVLNENGGIILLLKSSVKK